MPPPRTGSAAADASARPPLPLALRLAGSQVGLPRHFRVHLLGRRAPDLAVVEHAEDAAGAAADTEVEQLDGVGQVRGLGVAREPDAHVRLVALAADTAERLGLLLVDRLLPGRPRHLAP